MKGRGRHYAIAKRELVERFGGKCQRCGYDRCMRALQFHHADDSENKASGCTPILVTKNPNGKYSPKPAARLVYEIHKGTMPERHKLWRTCETVGCVNPDHQQPRRRKGPRPKGRNGIRGSQQPTLFI
jgi:hypothetical protein